MPTQLLGKVEFDADDLAAEIDRSAAFSFPAPYPEFSLGRPWRGCMLWAAGGEVGGGVINTYDTSIASRPTENGEKLSYLREVIEQTFVTEHLLFARLAVMSQDVFVPHRDYVEFEERPCQERASYRLHLPLVTSEDCLFIEDDVVYRMWPGEVWLLDVSRVHSAAVLSDLERIHLMLDFGGAVAGVEDLLRFDVMTTPGIPRSHQIDRPTLSPDERRAILSLSSVIDVDNIPQVLGILTKKSYRRRCGDDFAWGTLAEIARLSGDPDVRVAVREMCDYSVRARPR